MNKKCCVLIPCYNEEKRLDKEIFIQFAIQHKDVHILFINDGSTDNTQEVLLSIAKESNNISVHTHRTNIGKGNAIREGMLYAIKHIPCSYYAYFDADLSTPLSELQLLVVEMENDSSLQMVFGSRILKIGSSIERRLYRHYIGRIVATCISFQLGLSIYDTQCGAKLFKADEIEYCFAEKFISTWLFDVEIFNKLQKKYGKQKLTQLIKEVPLTTWHDVKGSKIGFTDIFKIPYFLLRIAYKYK